MQKTNSKVYSLIIVISFIMMSLLGSVHFWCFNESFYKSEHDKLMLYGKHISEYIGISDEDLEKLTHFTLSYLNDPKASLDIQMNVKGKQREIFTDDEKAHMVDVRNLNQAANYLLFDSCVVFVAFMAVYLFRKYSMTDLFVAYKNIIKYLMIFIGCVGLWILIDFDGFWTFFHHVFFPGNDLWLLDLRSDILIMIVPPEFFNHLVVTIVITFVLLIGGFGTLLYFLSKKEKVND
ncbi:MAG: TIGR01906 family membrane protein [Erysipelotrichaceae bacterium]|nr:TIGR01906 family membrane protein [Erysipelotrichaceae bacterium]